MFALQVLLFWFLPNLTAVSLMTIVTFVMLMCYGGGFGTMPAFAADYFGSKNVGPIYGLMLTAWGCASIVGPGLIAYMRQTTGSYRGALHIIAGVMAVSALVPILVSRPGGGVVDARGRTNEGRGPVPKNWNASAGHSSRNAR
jgi:OFA family oxalate/formate antiporter-like MFS transporter